MEGKTELGGGGGEGEGRKREDRVRDGGRSLR